MKFLIGLLTLAVIATISLDEAIQFFVNGPPTDFLKKFAQSFLVFIVCVVVICIAVAIIGAVPYVFGWMVGIFIEGMLWCIEAFFLPIQWFGNLVFDW